MKKILYLVIIMLGLVFALQSCCPNSCEAKTFDTELTDSSDQLTSAILETELPAAAASIVKLESNRDLAVYEIKHNGYTYIVVHSGAGLAIAKE